jgi:hypothetical protein
MKPRIDQTTFGAITIDQQHFAHDVLIRLRGQMEKRKKKLSKSIYGTSHVVSLPEAKHSYEPGTKRLIIGTGKRALFTCVRAEHRRACFPRGRA